MNKNKLMISTLTATMLSFQALAAKLNIPMPDLSQHAKLNIPMPVLSQHTILKDSPWHYDIRKILSDDETATSDGQVNEGTEGGNDDPTDDIITNAKILGIDTLNIDNDGSIIVYHDYGFKEADLKKSTLHFAKVVIHNGITQVDFYIRDEAGTTIGLFRRSQCSHLKYGTSYSNGDDTDKQLITDIRKNITQEKKKKRRNLYLRYLRLI